MRPTPDRVRQTLFNWLGQDLHGRTCLDLFAGSGALGFEALSRGAAQVTLVESDPAVYRALGDNARILGAMAARVVNSDATGFLAHNALKFDVIFLDPPFGQDWLGRLLPVIGAHLAPGGALYVEAAAPLRDVPGWQLVRQGRAGRVYYHLLAA